ncbi:MAG: N-acetylmuramoyl-L-alanine amidase [Bacteroidota bacterium]
MKKIIFTTVILFSLKLSLFSQNLRIDENSISKTNISKSFDETKKRGVSSSVHIFEAQDLKKVDDSYVLKFETSSAFTCFGIGWKSSNNNIKAGDFKIAFKTEKTPSEKVFGHVKTGEGENVPEETTTGMYWSELFFGYDESARKQLFIVITPPSGVSIDQIRIDVMDLSKEIDSRHATDVLKSSSMEKSITCPATPTIIQRADWCGSYTACTGASYTPTTITPTHTVIHHGASPDTYTDGYAVVRSYWNYHVNTLGWSDIGYNYLFDKYGNVFLGRKNANYLTVDVQGAHAGNSNGKSIGINFLGNGDVTQPTAIQLQKVYEMLAWWFKSRNITPNTSASLLLQSGGTATLPRILGHKDTNIGGTACPGTAIYALLPTMRTEVTNIINACNTVVLTPSNLVSTVGACPTNNVNFSWTNSGTGWYIQVSSSASFTTPYYKYVSGLTSYSGPANFVLQSDGVTPLTLNAGQTYYWRIWDNTSFYTGTPFTMNAAPAYPSVISGTTDVCIGSTYNYSIAAVSGASSYTWTVPSGSTITTGQNTNAISVTFSNTSGNVAVSANNVCGSSSLRTLSITTKAIASQPSTITGTASICSGTTNSYSIPTVSNATSYTWSVPSGSTISSGQNSTTISVLAGTTSGNISVSASNSCGTSALRTLAITSSSAPTQASAITGSASVCSGTSYSYNISAVSGASSYTWSVPSGSTISTGQNSTTISVLAGSTSGNISVTASNSCGTSIARTLAITASVCADVTKPTTTVTSANLVSTNFTATFTDADNAGGSGLKNKFYQVTDLTGSDRRSNKTFGFYNDNFNTAIHADWTASGGTWAVTSGVLTQQDGLNANTNLYTSLTQATGNQYLYNWKMKISGTGTNKRAGLHFFCEDASQSNRLNSYMVYFRADGNVVQIYEYLNNVMSLKVEAACTVTPGVQYDYKVILNTVTGEIIVYQNDVMKATWTDTTPLTLGNQVSLRTGECLAEYDDFRVFKSRSNTAVVTVGNATTKEIRYQNVNQTASSGKIVTINTDIANNISLESSKNVNVDFYGPNILTNVNDGTGADIATQTSTTSISGNWLATTDPNNTVTSYSYAIGTTTGGSNIVSWTNIGNTLAFTKTALALTVGTTYYVSVKSYNSSGFTSSVKSSNGVLIVAGMIHNNEPISEILSEKVEISVFPNPTTHILNILGMEAGKDIQIYDLRGQVVITKKSELENAIDVSELINGIYFVGVLENDKQVLKRFIKN